MSTYDIIPQDFFSLPEIKLIRSFENGNEIVLLWLNLFLRSQIIGTKRVYEWKYTELTDETIATIFDFSVDNTHFAMRVLEEYGLINRSNHEIIINMLWDYGVNERRCYEYKLWREAVLKRDGYECQMCGSNDNLHAHHIIAWASTEDGSPLRFDVDNGVTLCKECHLKAHNGCWRNI